MAKCDLTEAIENAAIEYLKGLLINRIMKLLGRRAALALATLLGGAIADGPLPIGDIIGLLISIGIAIWTLWDIAALVRKVVDAWRANIWDAMRNRLAQYLLKIDPDIMDCLDEKPECCLLVIRKAGKILTDWVKGLRPGWKKGSALKAGAQFSKQFKKIKKELADPLQECCS
ncbi:MAG: hypothetical protein FH748_03020 [Balneolaceae bacterium]|nr:hypothetical protein [Balneolaceae bacterium]